MNIGFIGYGEVGFEMSASMSGLGIENIYTYDPLKVGSSPLLLSDKTKVTFFDTAEKLVENNLDILFVAVPASYAKNSWLQVINSIQKDTILVDLTTASAQEKIQINEELEKKGLSLIDAAILGALKVYQHRVPILASGENVSKFLDLGNKLDMNIDYLNENVGDATNFKYVRSIFTKGLSTLLFEVFSTAENLNIRDEIFNSINTTMDKDDFSEIVNRYIKSNVPHSKRRETEIKNVLDFMKANDSASYMTEGTKRTLELITAADLNETLKDDYNWKDVIEKYNNQ